MKISLEWLKKYVNLDGISADAVEKSLTMIGFEVEGVESDGLQPLDKCVVGEVLSREQHPDADRLGVCQVDVGAEEPLQIVCGASNYKVGDRVPVAQIGCVLGGDFKIKKSKLRGVKSFGMMCSARELGMGDDHAGLLILEERPAVGASINDVFPGGDVIYDIEVTPNRPDCLSHVGIAREIAAYFDVDFTYPEVHTQVIASDREKHLVKSITVDSPEDCPYYMGWSIRGVKVAPSPEWLQKALTRIGLRPINNVVDVTNYVLMELGQPLHAFDAANIKGEQIIVRKATESELLTTLDDVERKLDSDMAVIADAERALVVAGVMGGVDAEVSESTSDVFLEAAYFSPTSVRKTARRLILSTDSSYRYERGVDPKGAEFAAMRAIDLILELAGGELVGAPMTEGHPLNLETEIEISGDYVRKSLGFSVKDAAIKKVFELLELDVKEVADEDGKPYFIVGIPSFRIDLARPCDLVEEFLRIYGTDKIPSARVESASIVREDSPITQFLRSSSTYLVNKGLSECVHYPLRSEEEIKEFYPSDVADLLSLANPLASDQSHLRCSMIPGLLDTVALNQARHNHPFGLFEVGRMFREQEGKIWETVGLGFVLSVEQATAWTKKEEPGFYTASQLAQDIMRMAGVQFDCRDFKPEVGGIPWQAGHAATYGFFEAGFQAQFGLLDVAWCLGKDIEGTLLAGNLWFTPEFLKGDSTRKPYEQLSLFPPANRDLALVVPADTAAGEVSKRLESIATELVPEVFKLESVSLFDVYAGKGLVEGTKSLAYSLSFRSLEKTLKDKDVNKVFDAIQKKISEETDYEIRS